MQYFLSRQNIYKKNTKSWNRGYFSSRLILRFFKLCSHYNFFQLVILRIRRRKIETTPLYLTLVRSDKVINIFIPQNSWWSLRDWFLDLINLQRFQILQKYHIDFSHHIFMLTDLPSKLYIDICILRLAKQLYLIYKPYE